MTVSKLAQPHKQKEMRHGVVCTSVLCLFSWPNFNSAGQIFNNQCRRYFTYYSSFLICSVHHILMLICKSYSTLCFQLHFYNPDNPTDLSVHKHNPHPLFNIIYCTVLYYTTLYYTFIIFLLLKTLIEFIVLVLELLVQFVALLSGLHFRYLLKMKLFLKN